MGNAASAEAPRKSPQKLSKTRAGSHVQTAGLLSRPGDISASSSSGTRYSSSYLAASLPPSPRDPAYLEAHQPPPRRLSRRESTRSELSSYAASSAGGRVSRANSVLYRHSDRPLARTQSWHGHRLEKRRSLQSDMHVYGSQQLPRASSEFLQDLGSHRDQQLTQQATSLSSHSNQFTAPTLSRTDSDLSLYVPIRRRSVIQTPGVATRPQREHLPSPLDMARARRSHPLPLADHSVFKPTVNKTARRVSLPPRPVQVEPQQRAVTPCEADYKQLGGIKFGSLRITNGSPTSSPVPERGQSQTLRPRSLSAQDSLEEERHGGGIEMAQPKPHNNAAGPIVTSSAQASDATKPPQVSSPELEFINGLMASPFSNDLSFSQFNLQLAFADATHVVGPVGNEEENSSLELPDVLQDRDNETPVNRLDAFYKSYAGVSRSDSGFGSTSSSETARHESSKADSGYSSNVSLRSSRSSSHIRPESDRFIYLGAASQGRQHEKRRRTLNLEKPQPSSVSPDGSHKHGKVYGLLVSSQRRTVAMDHATWGDSMDHRIRLPTTPQRRFSHKVGPSSATLNTILSVESLVSPDDSQTDSDVREAEAEQIPPPSHPLKKRRSLRAVADFAHAATSRMPSLKRRHRKSVTCKPTRSDKDEQASAAASESYGAADSIPQDRSRPVRTRASAPDLRLSVSDPAPASPTTSASSSQMMSKTPSPRVQRSRSMRDSGIPPPIPPRFRTSELLTSEPPPSLTQKHPNWPWQREHGGTGLSKWHRRFMRQNLGSPEESQPYRIPHPHNYNPSTHRGVPVLG